MRARNLVKGIFIGTAVLIVVLYGFSKTRDLIFGTSITLISPKEGETVIENFVEVIGHVGHANKLEMNGKAILPDEDGNFKKTYALTPGLNRITIMATDRFDRTISKTVAFFHKTDNVYIAPEVNISPEIDSMASTSPSLTATTTETGLIKTETTTATSTKGSTTTPPASIDNFED